MPRLRLLRDVTPRSTTNVHEGEVPWSPANPQDSYRVRALSPADFEVIMGQRRRMFIEAGFDESVVEESLGHYGSWLKPRLADGRYFGWIIEHATTHAVVAGSGMVELEWPPHPRHPRDDRRGYVTNVYVDASERRRGLASRLMRLSVDEAHRRNLGLMTLHATDDGRPLYEMLGWQGSTEMTLAL